jgi:plastocyanin
VYAIGPGGPVQARPNRTAIVAQSDREFVPFVTVIQVGTTVSFPNRDPILHHVYSFSEAKPFEIKLYSGQSPSTVNFDRSGVVTLGCNIHDWMLGYIVVVPTPYFARTDANGVAHLRDLPAGNYELRAWHPRERAPQALQALSLARDAKAAFRFDLAARKSVYKPPLDRMRY